MKPWITAPAVLLLALASCVQKEAPPPAAPPPAVVEPPPPKCDDLAQGCTVKAGRRAKIGVAAWTVELPNGWTYAEEATVAVATAQTAGVAMTTAEIKDTKREKEARDEAFKQLTSKLSVTLGAKNAAWPKKPQRTTTVGSLKVALFQVDVAERGGKKGPLLLFQAKEKDVLLVGAGFVSDDDSTNADAAILKCIESLATASEAKDAKDAGAP